MPASSIKIDEYFKRNILPELKKLGNGKIYEEIDPDTGVKTEVGFDPLTNRGYIKQHASPKEARRILIANEAMLAEAKKNWRGDYHRVARVPLLAEVNYCQQRGIDNSTFRRDRKEQLKFLNDYEHKAVRIKKGVL